MRFFKDDWFMADYDNQVVPGLKPTPTAKWNIHIKKTITRPVKSYKEELLLNAQVLRDSINGPLDLLLSGGVDSEIILRCYKQLKIPLNVFIFRYEDNINIRDFTQAMEVCKCLNVTPTIIDLNLKKFFETEAYDLWKTGYFYAAGFLISMKMVSCLDNTPMFGNGLVTTELFRKINNRHICRFIECNFQKEGYFQSIGRQVIYQWHSYSPELIVSFLNSSLVKLFINCDLYGMDCFQDFKYLNFRAMGFPIKIRDKLMGFEGHLPTGSILPEYMNEFNVLYKTGLSNKVYYFQVEDLIELL